jgi:hypothetical protein
VTGDFYEIMHEGQRLSLPRVTSILKVIDKSGPLIGWATKLEASAWRATLEEVVTRPGLALTPQSILQAVDDTLKGRRAFIREQNAAAEIGSAAHAMIHWHTNKLLGLDVGPEPAGPDASMRAVVAWLDWCKDSDFTPLYAERVVYCPTCAYAGTVDAVAKISGVVTTIDYKTGKAVYPEAHLQVRAYRHALLAEGIATDAGLILRLPKTEADPGFDPVPAMDIPLSFFRSVASTWRVNRTLNHQSTGNTPMWRCRVEL